MAHPAAFVLLVLVDGTGGRRRGRLAGRWRRRGVADGSAHVQAQLAVDLGLVDGGQLVPRQHPIGAVHADDGLHHHGGVSWVLARVTRSQVLQEESSTRQSITPADK